MNSDQAIGTKAESTSIHDNNVYAYTVNCGLRRITIHTEFRDREPHEWTDVVFSEVLAHHFENCLQSNILFDIEEVSPSQIIDGATSILSESWRHNWPPIEYGGDLGLLKRRLDQEQIRAFAINSSLGLCGWILAKTCERRPRLGPQAVA